MSISGKQSYHRGHVQASISLGISSVVFTEACELKGKDVQVRRLQCRRVAQLIQDSGRTVVVVDVDDLIGWYWVLAKKPKRTIRVKEHATKTMPDAHLTASW
ncbi:hypothetical protein N7G274_009670 [Stereocaulon virgatum]|uniref:Transposase n=1 Tax=Stereocaulon virgatum TaxID=373712 RepID=A0ABR3ZW60_9LECA